MQDILFRPFCRFLKERLENHQIFLGHKVPNYFSTEEDVIAFLGNFESLEERKIDSFIQDIVATIPSMMSRPHLFTKFFLDYFLKTGNVSTAKEVFLQEIHYNISLRRCEKVGNLLKNYAHRVSITKKELHLYQMIMMMIKGDAQELEKLAAGQSQEFYSKFYEVLACFLRRKIFRKINHDELLKIKIESMATNCKESLNANDNNFLVLSKQLLDFILEELYLNPEKDFIFQYTSEIINHVFISNENQEAEFLQSFASLKSPKIASASLFKYFDFTSLDHKPLRARDKASKHIVRKTIKKFKLESVNTNKVAKRQEMKIKSVLNINWQELLQDGRDIIDLLKTTQDSTKLKNYILKELDKIDLEITRKISLLSQLVFLLEQEGNTELAYSLCSHLSRALPKKSGDWLMFQQISEKLCEKLKINKSSDLTSFEKNDDFKNKAIAV